MRAGLLHAESRPTQSVLDSQQQGNVDMYQPNYYSDAYYYMPGFHKTELSTKPLAPLPTTAHYTLQSLLRLFQFYFASLQYIYLMLEEHRQSTAPLGATEASTQILKEFYSLHYPAKKSSGLDHKKLRSNSVMAVNQHYNPEIDADQQIMRRKRSVADKITQHNHNLAKSKERKQKQQPFSFKRMLMGREQRRFVNEYFTSSCLPKHFNSLQELANHNSNIKNAMQKCKDEKLKINKVLASQKQSQDTKMDYLQLKRKQIQQQKINQIRAIYEQFFKKDYEELYGESAYSEFYARINETVALVRSKVFGK